MDNVLYDSFAGIGIAKLKFDVAVCLADKKIKYKTFDNNPKGYEAFHQWLMQFGKQPLTLTEAAGIYHEALADFLYANGAAVAVINPRCTPNIAKSANIRSKTDQTDAKLPAEFARKNADDIRLYQPRPAPERELLLKTRQLEHLKKIGGPRGGAYSNSDRCGFDRHFQATDSGREAAHQKLGEND